MKVKDLERTAVIAWSPETQHPIYLAAGTAAQQLDASFNTSAALEVYSLNLAEPGPDLSLTASVQSENRFHKVIWGSEQGAGGTIVGGCDGGLLQIYNAQKLLKNQEDALIGKQQKHSGPVSALDFNPFQQNLFASGAADSEIFIWDLNHTNKPMSPGAKVQPNEDVLSVSWNRQVQHILASTFASKCVIWDLRKNEAIIKLTDHVTRIRWKVVAWHPEVATQLCLASEEDQSPVIQIWDLRFATSPLKTLENHQRGVLSLAWCAKDPDLLVSCGKDNRILCWNPNSNQQTGEVLSEIAKTNQWTFDLAWCPKNPALIASSNFDGHVSIYSIMGGQTQQIQTSDKIADSFPGMDGYIQAQVPQNTAPISVDLSKPPKWLKKPVGAKFGFGGKLISFEHDKEGILSSAQAGQQATRLINISQVITEPELVQKSSQLEQALEYGNFVEYCVKKADSIENQHKKYIWHFLKANFEPNPRAELLNLLGYKIEDINEKLTEFVGKNLGKINLNQDNDVFNNLSRLDDFDSLNNIAEKPKKTFKITTGNDTDGLIAQAILLNNIEAAVELCLSSKRYTDALLIATTGGPELLAKTQQFYLKQSDSYVTSLISALVNEDWGSIINNCDISCWKEALAAALTHSSEEDFPLLCEQLGQRLEAESLKDPKLSEEAQLCYICSGSFEKLVSSWSDSKKVASTNELQELVELVMFLQKSVERQGRHVQISGSLADLLSNYASLLAAQGDLKAALNYLGASQNEKVAGLRDRLYVSLGQKPAYVQERRRGSSRTSFTNYQNNFATSTNTYNAVPPPVQQPQFNSFNTGLPPQGGVVQAAQPPKTYSPGPPPRPTSVGSSTGGASGLPSRKYVVDPSVSSNQYGMVGAPQMAPQMAPSYGGGVYNPAPIPPANPVVSNPGVMSGYSGMMGAPPAPVFSSAPGWNDPPALSKSQRMPPKPEVPASEPILHPLYGAGVPQEPILPPSNGYNANGMYGQVPQQGYNAPGFPSGPPPGVFTPAPAPVAPQTYLPGGFTQNAVQNVNAPRVVQEEVKGVVEQVQKLPIPEEHIHMKTVFDELRNQCINAAQNPQIRRKLEEVGRKLESLYDLLREDKLSPNTLTSLHQMVQQIQHGDYPGGLTVHTQLVSGPDFAQIASFMPGLKVLLQCALQLQVYLR